MRTVWEITLCLVLSFWVCSPYALKALANSGEGQAKPDFGGFLLLSPKRQHEAQRLCVAANKRMDECRKLYRISPSDSSMMQFRNLREWPISERQIKDYEQVQSMYNEIVEKYPGTEVAAYAQLAIHAPCLNMRRYDEAIRQTRMVAETFEGSQFEAKAYLQLGHIYLQALRDPNRAMDWYEKVTLPETKTPDVPSTREQYDQRHVQYIRAQLHLARCEVGLGRGRDASRRCEELCFRYPQQKEQVEHWLSFELKAEMHRRFDIAEIDLLSDLVESDIFVSADSTRESSLPLHSASAVESVQLEVANELDSEQQCYVDPGLMMKSNPTTKAWINSRGVVQVIVASCIAILLGTLLALGRCWLVSGREAQ